MEKPDQKAFFAEYITSADCAEPTEWWFTIKDDEYDLSKLNSHDRRNVVSFKKHCYAKAIKPADYAKALFDCYVASFSAYPEKYRPKTFDYDNFCADVKEWSCENFRVYAAFTNDEDLLIGFALVTVIITNGSRSIKHETNFNAYLEKYFGFRKAYARLRVVYRFPFGIAVKLLKPFRKLFEHTENPFLYNLYCVLKMDSFAWRGK